MNGAMMYWNNKKCLYVEGYALDEFASGNIGLSPLTKKQQRVGLLIDKKLDDKLRTRHIQVAEAARATLGIDISSVVVTSSPMNVSIQLSSTGASWGTVDNIETMIAGAQELISNGCTAIAVVARFPEDNEIDEIDAVGLFDAYRRGEGVDAIAGVEALISHLITKKFMIPCAHAPAFDPIEPDPNVSPKACAEELGYTYLPCILVYLNQAPDLIDLTSDRSNKSIDTISRVNVIRNSDVDVVITPIDALGGPAVLSFISQNKLIIAIDENQTSMLVKPIDLSIQSKGNIVIARSYAEAAGFIVAHKEGILFESL
eukprot:CAMPEP_0196762016 /NCGR_PEP_ID=MMETSP1095-20130614/1348_1 /TAXON_ID=96789 ORGANISM="Chromulina nebulosa, Strain UTEXLB2642" /NCGR_SAMPLE_ID=MMETSP1095 /ASSEMBLY_ACC=CAM_ASM_000446 /LENGTH=314 /DNA_ID=CAMNT_0042112231 /DNA_START=211 /DNA_END=1152 /DNA_ORIENTATION=-